MGCHKCHDDTADEKTQRYHILIALMLSSQTKDQTNFAAMKRLKEHGLTPENIVKSDVNVLEKLIYPVSFYKVNTRLLQTLQLFDFMIFYLTDQGQKHSKSHPNSYR